jgi:hypothetical protein
MNMRESLILGALALATALLPAAAMADDPHDPAMRTTEARARDRAIIRRLIPRPVESDSLGLSQIALS